MVAQQTTDWSSVLKTAAEGGAKLPPLLVVWGPGGIGKTTFATRAPSPAVFAFEVGARSAAGTKVFPPEGTIQTWTEALTYARALAYGVHSYKTLVLDSLNPLEALVLSYVVERSGKGSYEKMGWGKDATVVTELRVLLGLLERCKARGMQVIVTAHDRRRNIKDPVLGEYSAFTASTQVEQVWNAVFEWADVVGFCRDDYGVVEGKAIKVSDARTLHTRKGAGYQAKQRSGYEMQSPIPLDWRSFAEALERGGDTADVVISRITALALDIGDSDVAAKAKKYVDECAGDVGKLLELENQMKLMKEKSK